MKTLEVMYEEVLEEGAIWDFLRAKENRHIVKQIGRELGLMGLFSTSPPTMAYYVNKFLSDNYPNLGSDIINKIAEFLSNHPQVLELFK